VQFGPNALEKSNDLRSAWPPAPARLNVHLYDDDDDSVTRCARVSLLLDTL